MQIVLGSQSPQRRELLSSLVPDDRFEAVPPNIENEPGFDDCATIATIETRLNLVVAIKHQDVSEQLQHRPNHGADCCLVCADTIVVATDQDSPLILGKPPQVGWQQTVRDWFARYYSGRTHEVWTGFRISCDGQIRKSIVKTQVTFGEVDEWWLDWYLSQDESTGKAGGYGIQGHASVFVESISGSLTNVIGLPLKEVALALRELGVLAPARQAGETNA